MLGFDFPFTVIGCESQSCSIVMQTKANVNYSQYSIEKPLQRYIVHSYIKNLMKLHLRLHTYLG